MKKFLHFFALLSFFYSSSAQTRQEIDSAVTKVSRVISYKNPYQFGHGVYAELAYLKRTHNLTSLSIDNDRFIGSLNDFYYKKFFLFSKLLDENAIVTEDCLQDEVNQNTHKARKLLFYCLYPNSIKLPTDIVEQLEEYSTVDEFLGPYMMLFDIYFLKKYNIQHLSKKQKEKLSGLETRLCELMYNNYVKDKPWDFHKFLSLKVLKMNKSDLIRNINISDLVSYVNSGAPIGLSDADEKNTALLQKIGAKDMFEQESTAVLWLFLLERDK